MRYFTIDESIDLDMIGEYPQVSPTENCVLGSPFSNERLSFGEIPNKIPYLELEFNKRAKKTDLLSSYNSHWGILINKKIKRIIVNFNIPTSKFYSFILLENRIIIKDYYLFRFYDDIFQYIDMERSKFILKWRDVSQEFCFTSKDFFKSKKEKTFEDFEKNLIIKEVYLLNSFPQYDIFHFEGRNIISEKLLKAFIENNITGYEVSAYDVLKLE